MLYQSMKFLLCVSSFRKSVSLFVMSLLAAASLQAAPEPEKETDAERWEAEIGKFAERDALHPPGAKAWLFVGSSSIRLWDLEASFTDRPLINNGFGGSKLSDAVVHFDKLFSPYDPSAIVIYGGDNDVGKGATATEVVESFEALAGKIREAFPSVPVVFLGIKPSIKRWKMWPVMREANARIAEACNTLKGFRFADTAALMLTDPNEAPSASWFREDGLHLSASGYAAWSALVEEIVTSAAPE